MKLPLVSILIPYKNTEKYLRDCILSVIAQSYPHWEVLAVNDHSSDQSQEIMDQFAQNDPRIKNFDNGGKGIIDALKTAYAASKGELITRMDSDDIMSPQKLEVMVNALLAEGNGHIAIGKVKYFSHRGISNGYERYENWLNALTARGGNFEEIYKECVIPSPCWMVHRSDLDACGAFEPDRYPEDYDLTFRFYEKNLKCIPCDQVLHHWRDYDSRTSRTSEHYAQNYFLGIKLFYFLKLDRDINRPLVLWGAGNKGKDIARQLVNQNIAFHWICDNPKKIGKSIYGQEMLHFDRYAGFENAQSIITVANEAAQTQIRDYFFGLGKKEGLDYYFFC